MSVRTYLKCVFVFFSPKSGHFVVSEGSARLLMSTCKVRVRVRVRVCVWRGCRWKLNITALSQEKEVIPKNRPWQD